MCKNSLAKISIVGAGPGDPELITIKGLKALQSANVVLYDALAATELLEFAPQEALKIYVGKRSANHRYPQEEINQMMIQYALSHGHVVRLKGGDPFVFGRGHEEMQFAKELGVPLELIPGISSCTSLPALQEVPVTRRGISESFWVMTGTTRKGTISADLYEATNSSATLVILMGIRKIQAIMELFIASGKSEVPVLVVQNGSRPNERKVLGRVGDIVEKVHFAKIGAPGIIIIGEVVALHPEWDDQALVTTNLPKQAVYV